jgi:hypothetical protein
MEKNKENKEVFEFGTISIKPNVKETNTSMGLEGYDMVVFPKVSHSEPMSYISKAGGVRRYINGLDEEHPSIKGITDKEEKNAKILGIRKAVQYLEKSHSFNVIPDSELEKDTFWNNVKTFYPTNKEFYSTISISFDNNELFLFPKDDILDLVKYYSLKCGGFSLCSTDKEACDKEGKRWYLSNEFEDAKFGNESTRLKNKAIAVLENLMDEGNNKLFYISKILMPDASSFKLRTSKDTLYESLDAYLNGRKNIRTIKDASNRFIAASELKGETLFIKAIVQDLYNYNQIVINNNSHNYVDSETKEAVSLGRNTSEVVEFFSNPVNQEFCDVVQKSVKERYW